MFFRCALSQWLLSAFSYTVDFSVRFAAGVSVVHSLVGVVLWHSYRGAFSVRSFKRNFMRSLPQEFFSALLHRGLYPSISLWGLSHVLIRCGFFCLARGFACAVLRVFLPALFARVIFVRSSTKACFARLLAGIFSLRSLAAFFQFFFLQWLFQCTHWQGFSCAFLHTNLLRGTSRCRFFRSDPSLSFFRSLFRKGLIRALFRRGFFGALFHDSFCCALLTEVLSPCDLSRAFFPSELWLRFFDALLWGSFFCGVHCPWRDLFPCSFPQGPFSCIFLLRFFTYKHSPGFFRAVSRGGSSCALLQGLLYFALSLGLFLLLFCNEFFRALFRRGFFSDPFPVGYFCTFLHRGLLPATSRWRFFRDTFRCVFPWAFLRGLFCGRTRNDFLHAFFRRNCSRAVFPKKFFPFFLSQVLSSCEFSLAFLRYDLPLQFYRALFCSGFFCAVLHELHL